MKVEFSRWDIEVVGTEPLEEQGQVLVGLDRIGCGRTFRGSRWAIMYDLQWQYLCGYPFEMIKDRMSWGWFPPRCTDYGYTHVQKNRVAKDRSDHVLGAVDFAEGLLAMPPDDYEDWCMKSLLTYRLDGTVFRGVLERMVEACGVFTPTPEDRAYWIVLGLQRWQGAVPRTVEAVGECAAMSLDVPTENTCRAKEEIISNLRKQKVLNPLKTFIELW
jgi:hypothetical protein